jgi:hypothetical protein
MTRGAKTKSIVITTAKSTPVGLASLAGKQAQTAAFLEQLAQTTVVTVPAQEEEVKAMADCTI